MKNLSLMAAAGVVLIANAFALVHAARNRGGALESELTLTQRELSWVNWQPEGKEDDSGVSLNLQWQNAVPAVPEPTSFWGDSAWMDEAHLRALGFDCSVPATSPDAVEFYRRQRPRTAFVALEYDGPAWRAWSARQAATEKDRQFRGKKDDASHLVAVDADLNAASLRGRHPDRLNVAIVPAVIRINGYLASKSPARLSGTITEIQSKIHVPLPLGEQFRRLPAGSERAYKVRLRFGRLLEPWIESVEFTGN